MSSPLGDVEYKASSTNMKNIIKYLFGTNRIQDEEFESLAFKNNISAQISTYLEEA